MQMPILEDAVILFGLSIGVIVAFHRFRVPAIIGFLLTGVLAGPHGLGLVTAAHEVEVLAEIGVILLLFVIGMELSFDELANLRKEVFLGGTVQLLGTVLLFEGLALALGYSGGKAAFFGFLAALSSTAVVLKLLADRAESYTPQGRISLSVLIFQDIMVVPMMLLVPFLAGGQGSLGQSLIMLAGKAVLVMGAVAFLAKVLAPRILLAVVRTRSRELFLMTTLGLCFAIALLTSHAGLSLSLGAFLAGLIISQSEYSLSALDGILPFRDVFTSIFFVSIGMLLDMGAFFGNLPAVLGVSLAVLVLKAVVVVAAALVLGTPLRVALISGLALCQIGEFSFVLAGVGMGAGLMAQAEYQLFLSAAIVTMAATPFLIMAAPRIADALADRLAGRLAAVPLLRRLHTTPSSWGAGEPDGHGVHGPRDHLLVVGFGVGGKHLARAARMAGIDYAVLEMNPDTVRREAKAGEPIRYGDAAQVEVLKHAGVERARVLALVIADPAATRRIVETARRLAPGLHIVARTRFVSEIEPLRKLGANQVVAEEFETSVELFNRVLSIYLAPRGQIEAFTAAIRAEGYGKLRQAEPNRREGAREGFGDGAVCLDFAGHELAALRVTEGAPLAGKSLVEADLRAAHGLMLIAIRRDGEMLVNPGADERLLPGDVAHVFGEHEALAAKAGLFTARPETAP